MSQKKRAAYNNVNNLRTEVPIHTPFGPALGLPIWHIPTNFGQYILKNEDSGEFSARKGCATQWPSWEISMSVTKSHCRPIVLFHDVARSRFLLSALAYLSQTADRPVVDLRGGGRLPTRRINSCSCSIRAWQHWPHLHRNRGQDQRRLLSWCAAVRTSAASHQRAVCKWLLYLPARQCTCAQG